jgi:hypothetical protein
MRAESEASGAPVMVKLRAVMPMKASAAEECQIAERVLAGDRGRGCQSLRWTREPPFRLARELHLSIGALASETAMAGASPAITFR